LVAVSAAIYIRSRRVKVDAKNVNAEWEGSLTAGLEGEDQDHNPPADAGRKVGDDAVSAGNPS
jgi:PiT family inorganic phosphate transporter